MSLFKLKYENTIYINDEYYKIANHVGPTGLTKAMLNGDLRFLPFHGHTLLDIGEALEDQKYKDFDSSAKFQDLDKQLSELENANQDTIGLRVEIEGNPKVIEIKGIKFVRHSDFICKAKRALFNKMPSISIFGSKYIAVGAYLRNTKEPVIFTMK